MKLLPRMVLLSCVTFSTSPIVNADTPVIPELTQVPTPPVAGSTADDWDLVSKVKSAFANTKTLQTQNITVNSVHGVIELTGTVDYADQVIAAEFIASKVPGVKAVHNNLHPRGSSTQPE